MMTRKTPVFSVLAIISISLFAGAGTFAYFSDTESSTGNTFTAGTLDLTVQDQNDPNVVYTPWESSAFPEN